MSGRSDQRVEFGRVHSGIAQQERHADGFFVGLLLFVHALRAEHVAVVREEQEDRLLFQSLLLQGLEQQADAVV